MIEEYKQLKEKASKGPFEVPSKLGYPVTVSSIEGFRMVCQANGPTQDEAAANAQLIAFCLNKMPEVLERLAIKDDALVAYGLIVEAHEKENKKMREALGKIHKRLSAGHVDEWTHHAVADIAIEALKGGE